jgi:predicted aspartyl protease
VPGSPVLVDVRINGGRSLRLILDTGASMTVIRPRALSALGVDMTGARPAEVRGVTGTSQARMVRLESLEVGTVKAGPLWVLAHDASMPQGDGLLGRDFLDRFTVTLDRQERVVILSER